MIKSSHERWSPEEDLILSENYPTMKRNTSSLLPGRSREACACRARVIGCFIPSNAAPWTAEEDAILKEHYEEMGAIGIQQLLPHRSQASIHSHCFKLGLHTDAFSTAYDRNNHSDLSWPSEADDILRREYPVIGGTKVRDRYFPTRSLNSIYARARKLNLSCPKAPQWTNEEVNILRKNYPSIGAEGVHEKYLPNHTVSDCQSKAKALNLKKILSTSWSESELRILNELYPQIGKKVSEQLPGRSIHSIHKMANRLGLKGPAPDNMWTADEDDILRTYFPSEGIDMKDMLPGRTEAAILQRAKLIGVKTEKKNDGWMWSEEEDALLTKHYPMMGKNVQILLPNRTPLAIQARARKLHLTQIVPTIPKNAWTEKEDTLIQEMYPIKGASYIKEQLPHRTVIAIKQRASVLGLKKPPKKKAS